MKNSNAKKVYREATSKDIPRMKFIRDNVKENSLVSLRIEECDYEKEFSQASKAWVCEINGKVTGFSWGRLKQKDVWALFIDASYEGQGIGNQLMELLETWMFANGCDQIYLSTEPNTRAERLYRRRGWQFIGLNQKGEAEFIKPLPTPALQNEQ